MKIYLLRTEDSERRYFDSFEKAKRASDEWIEEYARQSHSTYERVKEGLGDMISEVELE